MPIFSVKRGRPTIVFDLAEQLVGKRHLLRPVHLRLDDVDRAAARVVQRLPAVEVVAGDGGGDQRVEKPFGDLAAVAVAHGVRPHVVADVAQQHQRSAGQPQLAAARAPVDAVAGQHAMHRLAVLLERLAQRALHQAEPVAVADHLVLGVDRRDRILHVHDRRDGGLDDDVGDARRVGAADRVGAVDHDLDMQAVVRQQHQARVGRGALVAVETVGEAERRFAAADQRDDEAAVLDAIVRGAGVRAGGERGDQVERRLGLGDHAGAAHGIVGFPLAGAAILGDRVGAVERIVEAAPARVGRVERVAGVRDRHHELRPGDLGDLRVDVGGGDRLRLGLRLEIADLVQETHVGGLVGRPGAMLAMPGVELRLQGVAVGEQLAVARPQLGDERGEPGEERVGLDAGAGKRLVDKEIVKLACDGEAVLLDRRHRVLRRSGDAPFASKHGDADRPGQFFRNRFSDSRKKT